MAIDEFSIPSAVSKKLKELGYTIPSSMASHIQKWLDLYTGADSFYSLSYISAVSKKKKSRKRFSLRPARKVCREWASLILNEDTEISVDDPAANEWLRDYLDRSKFWAIGQTLIEKAFALGTAAWALWFKVNDGAVTDIKIRRYDARMVVPISWDDDGVSECAFVTRVTIKGKAYNQLQVHAIEDGTYHIKTYLFDGEEEVATEDMGFLPDFDTEQSHKTFGIVKPGLDNVVADLSPYGISVFYDAIDAIKAVDLSWDSIYQEIDIAAIRVFMSEEMIDINDDNGKPIPVPDTDDKVFRLVAGSSANKMIDVFAPNIRIDQLKEGLNIALAELGDNCGFGEQYFQIGKTGGLKTATEVVSDNSVLMRSIKKHENSVGSAIKDVITGLISCAAIKGYAEGVPAEFGAVDVKFDDSIITDTQSEKNLMLAEISAGVVPKWKYAERFYGMSEEEAKTWAAEEEVIDIGF